MRRPAHLIVVLALVGATAGVATAGWRSADRMDDEEELVDPCERGGSGCEQPEWGDEQHFRNDQLIQDRRQLEPMRQAPPGSATQPYWGTMRPYWGSNEPPGVIHRGARTRDFKKPAKSRP